MDILERFFDSIKRNKLDDALKVLKRKKWDVPSDVIRKWFKEFTNFEVLNNNHDLKSAKNACS